MENLYGLLFVAIGVFALCGACFDWDWFMESRRARVFVALLTRTGARVFYGLLGLSFMGLGCLVVLGIVKHAR